LVYTVLMTRHHFSSSVLFLLSLILVTSVVLVEPSAATDVSLLTFGTGKTQVRLYSDYLCGACSKLEPQLEAVIADLVKKNKVALTFIDTPTQRQSPLFARYFLYIMNEKKDLQQALKARALLFEAAKIGVRDAAKLEEFLVARDVKFKTFDVIPVFKTLEGYIGDDKIVRTPMAVIFSGERKESYEGADPIVKALKAIK
jgi:hypothetical protein